MAKPARKSSEYFAGSTSKVTNTHFSQKGYASPRSVFLSSASFTLSIIALRGEIYQEDWGLRSQWLGGV